MADVQFDEGSIIESRDSTSSTGGGMNEAKGMAGWLIRVSGDKLSPQTANIILASLGVGLILLSLIIIWRM